MFLREIAKLFPIFTLETFICDFQRFSSSLNFNGLNHGFLDATTFTSIKLCIVNSRAKEGRNFVSPIAEFTFGYPHSFHWLYYQPAHETPNALITLSQQFFFATEDDCTLFDHFYNYFFLLISG